MPLILAGDRLQGWARTSLETTFCVVVVCKLNFMFCFGPNEAFGLGLRPGQT